MSLKATSAAKYLAPGPPFHPPPPLPPSPQKRAHTKWKSDAREQARRKPALQVWAPITEHLLL